MKKVLLAITAVVSSVAAVNASAASISTTAAVTIVEPLTITEVTQMSFGKIVKPTSDSVVTLTNAGAASVTSGDALVLGSSSAAGTFTITGSSDSADTISISITDGSSEPGLAISSFLPKYNNANFTNGASGLAAPGTGKSLAVGATLAITAASVTAGVKSLQYNINVQYQ